MTVATRGVGTEMLRTLDEIGRWTASEGEPYRVLTNVACLIGNELECHACSIYVVQPSRRAVVLAATVGLAQEAVGRIRMGFDEGLTGLVAETGQPVVVSDDASNHRRFRFFREAGEEPFESFLGVPILDRSRLEGVLVVQTIGRRDYDENETLWLGVAGRQLGPYVASLRDQHLFRVGRRS